MAFKHLQVLCLCLSQLISVVIGGQYRFNITDIQVNTTRAVQRDNLVLAIASKSDSVGANSTWLLGEYEAAQSIQWSNLTQKIVLPGNTSDLDVGFLLFNALDDRKASEIGLASQLGQGMAGIATALPIASATLGTLGALIGVGSQIFNCSGAVALGNVTYSSDVLANLDQHQSTCETKDYMYTVPVQCGFSDSNYTVTYCLERMDAKVVPAPQLTAGTQSSALPQPTTASPPSAAAISQPHSLITAVLLCALSFIFHW